MTAERSTLCIMEIEDGGHEDIEEKQPQLVYGIRDKPPWLLSIFLGYQHILPSLYALSHLQQSLVPLMCVLRKDPLAAYLISTPLLVSGISTILGLYIGTGLPILLLPVMYFQPSLETGTDCPSSSELFAMGQESRRMVLHEKMAEWQGALICVSFIKIILGYSGLIGLLVRFTSPLVITVLIVETSYQSFNIDYQDTSRSYSVISILSVILIIASQVLKCNIPAPWFTLSKGWHMARRPLFNLFSILLAVSLAWSIVTVANASVEYNNISKYVPVFLFNYPFQFGLPTISKFTIFALLPVVSTEIIKSIGEFYACAAITGEQPPPPRITSRGIAVEGIGTLISGMFGGTGSIAAAVGSSSTFALTKAASRRIIFCSAILMIIISMFPPLAAMFYYIPPAILLGLSLINSCYKLAIGFSILKFSNMTSQRNLTILAFSILISSFAPKVLEHFFGATSKSYALLGTITAMVLDNILPGANEGKGIAAWQQGEEFSGRASSNIYSVRFCDFVPQMFFKS